MPPTTTEPTNGEFAAKAGVHPTMASRLRNGERSPSITTLRRIAEAYELSAFQILTWLKAIDEGGSAASGQWLRENILAPTEGIPKAG